MLRLKRLRMIGAALLRATLAKPEDASVFKPIVARQNQAPSINKMTVTLIDEVNMPSCTLAGLYIKRTVHSPAGSSTPCKLPAPAVRPTRTPPPRQRQMGGRRRASPACSSR